MNRFEKIRSDFPILNQQGDKPLVYLDSAATTQKPKAVIDALVQYYSCDNANVHRGLYALSERATNAYEAVRKRVQDFINARHDHEIIFTHGTTDSINLVAQSYGKFALNKGDEIILSEMEHHSNIVPWQLVAEKVGAILKIVPVTTEGYLDLETYRLLFTKQTKIVALTHVSNVIGTINPVKTLIEIAHAHHVPVLLDGAQAMPHLPVDVQELDCDFYVFSSHKLYGPTGVGILYGKTKWLEKMPPYQGGGEMISSVSFQQTRYNVLPYKFEAGTPPIASVIGFGVALDYLETIGHAAIFEYETHLRKVAIDKLSSIGGLRLIANPQGSVPVISFILEGIHPHDIATVLDSEGVAIRAGHHCAMPLMTRFGVPATARISLGVYNNIADIEHCVYALGQVNRLFGKKYA